MTIMTISLVLTMEFLFVQLEVPAATHQQGNYLPTPQIGQCTYALNYGAQGTLLASDLLICKSTTEIYCNKQNLLRPLNQCQPVWNLPNTTVV